MLQYINIKLECQMLLLGKILYIEKQILNTASQYLTRVEIGAGA